MKNITTILVFLSLISGLYSQSEVVQACFETKVDGYAQQFYPDFDPESGVQVLPRNAMIAELDDYFQMFLESYDDKEMDDDTTFFETVSSNFGQKQIKIELRACFTGKVLETRGDSILVEKLSKDSMLMTAGAEIIAIKPLMERVFSNFKENMYYKKAIDDIPRIIDEMACAVIIVYNGASAKSSKQISPCENEYICSCHDGIEDKQWFLASRWTPKTVD